MTEKPYPFDPVALLDALKGYPFLHPFSLAVYSFDEGFVASRDVSSSLCSSQRESSLCSFCPLMLAAREARDNAVPTVCRCHLDIFGFALRLGDAPDSRHTLLGWGVRADSIHLAYLENITRKNQLDPFPLLDRWGDLPEFHKEDVKQVVKQVQKLLPSLQGHNLHTQLLEKTVGQLKTVVDITAQIDRARSAEEVFAILSESVGISFDFPLIAVALPDAERWTLAVRGIWGTTGELATLPVDNLPSRWPSERFTLTAASAPELFRQIQADRATCFPLMAEDEFMGILLLFNVELHHRDALQIELLSARTAARLKRLHAGTNPLFDSSFPSTLTAIIETMARAEGRRELYRRILESAAELLHARSGSLMLFEEDRQFLRIETSIGLATPVSRNMRIKAGEGIAGKVAANGTPIVVNDIENDSRVAATNRPRFKTKSFLSIPLKLKGTTIGVVNLSDKDNDEAFTGADLQLVTILISQAAILIERNELLERTGKLERLSATDPVTGLYNHAFLSRRLDEELNRSSRQGLTFTLVLVEIDYFSLYTDICGRPFATGALQKGAALLCNCARQMDVVSRYGDETFCLLLPGTAKRDALVVARRIKAAFEQEQFPCEENLPTEKITTSIGLATFPDDASNSASILAAAEGALYQAKAAGRNRMVAALSPVDPEAAHHI
ncbi:MAG TPA: sensor domain-containing diguanylate cyclase [Geobacteraceae bacterium]